MKRSIKKFLRYRIEEEFREIALPLVFPVNDPTTPIESLDFPSRRKISLLKNATTILTWSRQGFLPLRASESR